MENEDTEERSKQGVRVDGTRALLIGSADALGAKREFVETVRGAGCEVTCRELDPAKLGRGFLSRLLDRRKLKALVRGFDATGVVILVERPGDTAWQPWMVHALGSGLRQVAVPARMKGQDNIAGSRSGVAVYNQMDTADDLDEIYRSSRWEAEQLAYVSHM